MSEKAADRVRETMDAMYRSESRRVLSILIRLLGDFDLAEEALHDAFAAAVDQWPRDGVPANPRAWLISTGPPADSRPSTASAGGTGSTPRSKRSRTD